MFLIHYIRCYALFDIRSHTLFRTGNTRINLKCDRRKTFPQFCIKMTSKRSHKSLTLAEKEHILLQLSNGVSGKLLAEKYGAGTSTISDIKKNKEKLKNFFANCAAVSKDRKVLREPDYPEMEDKLYKWFQCQRERHITVTTNILKEKPAQIHAQCYENKTFSASKGWLYRFKNRHG
ncbi:tigger transposable element-derived protein 2-like [Bactrocera dorsalis]|uniref:Tigger transposable element-derived protein 2-like n=1 Tax=Bactrocera dorsalis TaxID=27457 RepID=A0ABM3J5R1_BACDO|nr:tigger transposable element-derived protein 2-like [Bactrocera dorsalis]